MDNTERLILDFLKHKHRKRFTEIKVLDYGELKSAAALHVTFETKEHPVNQQDVITVWSLLGFMYDPPKEIINVSISGRDLLSVIDFTKLEKEVIDFDKKCKQKED